MDIEYTSEYNSVTRTVPVVDYIKSAINTREQDPVDVLARLIDILVTRDLLNIYEVREIARDLWDDTTKPAKFLP